jgi:general secretion pathway protein M
MATTASSRREGLAQWWQLRSRSERTVLALAATVLALLLGWLLIWQPLLQDTDRLTHQLSVDRITLAEAQRQADAFAGLARSAPQVAASDPRAALDAVLVAQRLKSAATSIERSDNERIRLTFDRISFDALTTFLDALQKSAQLRPVELVATARVEPGVVRADLTLAR